MIKSAIIIIILTIVVIAVIRGANSRNRGTFTGQIGNPCEKNGAYNPPEQHIRILKECMELLEKTTDPETYFSRAKIAAEKALYCVGEPQIVWNGLTSKQIYDVLTVPSQRAQVDQGFINQMFSAGKEDRMVFRMREVGGYMSKETLAYFVSRLNGKRYHFCKVRLDDSGKLYTYVTKDPAIKPGDLVTIPVGNGFDKSTKLKQVIEAYDAPLDTLGFPVNRLRCVEDKMQGPSVAEQVVTLSLMKLECPNCGASLQVDGQLKNCTCNYCGHSFLIDENHPDMTAKMRQRYEQAGKNAVPYPRSAAGTKGVPREYINALHEAYDYSNDGHMSRQEIYDTLTDAQYGDGFTIEAAQYALANMQVDWFENALAKAKEYYFDDDLSWSKKEIYEELTDMENGDKFTLEEAKYAMDHLDD